MLVRELCPKYEVTKSPYRDSSTVKSLLSNHDKNHHTNGMDKMIWHLKIIFMEYNLFV